MSDTKHEALFFLLTMNSTHFNRLFFFTKDKLLLACNLILRTAFKLLHIQIKLISQLKNTLLIIQVPQLSDSKSFLQLRPIIAAGVIQMH